MSLIHKSRNKPLKPSEASKFNSNSIAFIASQLEMLINLSADTETVERLKMMEFILGTSLAALIVLVHKYFTTATEYDSGDKG